MIPRPDASMGDAPRIDAEGAAPESSLTDGADARSMADVRSERDDEGSAFDAPNAIEADVGDAGLGAFDVADVELDASEVGSVDSGPPDVRDAPPIDVSDAPTPPTFYRAINVGGSTATALMIDGHSWEAGLTAPDVTYSAGSDAAGSGGLAQVTGVPLIPSTDVNRTSMIQNFAWGRPIAFTMTNVPAGRYLVYMYTWEDNGAQTFNILLQGQVVVANYDSGANGHWERLGPWAVNVSSGTIAIATTPTTGAAFANLCGVEVWRQ